MRTKLFLLLTVLICATTSWAQTNVSTDQGLRNAIADKANIKLTADINLNILLEIPGSCTVTIDLGGHTLNRGLTRRANAGQVITVRTGATLNLSNGTLTGGFGGNGGALDIESGTTVNLTDVTVTGNSAEDRGGGISNKGTLTMTGGAITDNTSQDNTAPRGGGGLFNADGATATLTGVTITGNKTTEFPGGGICNHGGGTLTINGCTITGNTAGSYGGGVWQEGTLNIQGANNITGNTNSTSLADNIYLPSSKLLTISGALTGSNIGVTLAATSGAFTNGYSTYNSGVAPATFFHADLSNVMEVTLDGNEAKLGSSLPGGTVYYIERSWDDASMTLKTEIKTLAEGSYTVLNNGDDITLQPGFYVVKGNIEVDDIILAGNGEHHFILCDGAQVEADILHVPSGQTAIIYGQANNSGRLYIPDGADDQLEEEACIGGRSGQSCGTVIIHGGDIDVVGRMKAAGIGGGKGGNGGTVTIYGGNITASGGSGAGAGIGGGKGGNGGIVTIYGGHIEAKGGNFGAGIGGGDNGNAATVTIHGGLVIARGKELGAGIGTGRNEDGSITYTGELTVTGGEVYAYGAASEFEGGSAGIGGGRLANGSKVTISGGYVYAKGGDFGAGIGSGCESLFGGGVQGGSLTVTGGRVEAYGGEDAAGIGGGEDADGGTVTISGGYVYAKGSYGGAGIGGGEGGDGGNVTITGGTVHASAGEGDTGNRAIGSGKGCDAYGQLTIGDEMMVTSERLAAAAERKNMCWYRTDARVEPCTHEGATVSINDGSTHSVSGCTYCTTATQAHSFDNYGECQACHLISLANGADNSGVIAHWNGATDKTVTLTGRTLYKNKNWNTLCLPFGLYSFSSTPLADATIMTLGNSGGCTTGYDATTGILTLDFLPASAIEPGVPYIVKWETAGDAIENPVFSSVTIENENTEDHKVVSSDKKVTFLGTYEPVELTANDQSTLYLGGDNKLYYPDAAMTINAFRSYFQVDLGNTEVSAIRMNFKGFNETTGIVEMSDGRRKMEDVPDGWHTLDGRKLNSKPSQRGVYIYKGHKRVIK